MWETKSDTLKILNTSRMLNVQINMVDSHNLNSQNSLMDI